MSEMVKISVLLPTKNGGKYLRECIESVLNQDYKNFELVISENATTDETNEILKCYEGNVLVKIIHQSVPLSVTDNWTATIERSVGEYCLMMGDDDFLMPGALNRLEEILQQQKGVDCVLFNAYSFIAPQSLSADQPSYYSHEHFYYDEEYVTYGLIGKSKRMAIVSEMFKFDPKVPLNMQTLLFSRESINKISEGKFIPPFPDHYLINALLIMANKFLVVKDKLVVIGISPKSFGHYVYGGDSKKGLEYLGISPTFIGMLPGSELLNGMYVWLLKLKENYPHELSGVDIDKISYKQRQLHTWILQYRCKSITLKDFLERLAKLSSTCLMLILVRSFFSKKSWKKMRELITNFSADPTSLMLSRWRPLENIKTIGQFSRWVNSEGKNS